ncbi:hypothetical protein F5146DRAFT_1145020 [Armillaria mellea]|nr:hypothetical protein F5146DRAFT_1145017 [Armillaria mellea]KAK0184887.1 hypothetical protein F5146DRAFT_1145020 [Armillaria mellea]
MSDIGMALSTGVISPCIFCGPGLHESFKYEHLPFLFSHKLWNFVPYSTGDSIAGGSPAAVRLLVGLVRGGRLWSLEHALVVDHYSRPRPHQDSQCIAFLYSSFVDSVSDTVQTLLGVAGWDTKSFHATNLEMLPRSEVSYFCQFLSFALNTRFVQLILWLSINTKFKTSQTEPPIHHLKHRRMRLSEYWMARDKSERGISDDGRDPATREGFHLP